MSKPITLILGGTGVKGITSVGVLQSLADHNVKIKKIIASGISALVSAQFAAGEDPYVMADQFTHFFEANQGSLWGLEQASGLLMKPRKGISDSFSYFLRERNYCYANFNEKASLSWETVDPMINQFFARKTFAQLKIPLAVSAIDLKQAKCVLIERGKLSTALKAAMAYPGVLPPVISGKMELVSSTMFCELPLDILTAEDSPLVAFDLPSPFVGSEPLSLLEVISTVDDIRARAIKTKLLQNVDVVLPLKGLKQFRWGDYRQIPLIVAHARKTTDKLLNTTGLPLLM